MILQFSKKLQSDPVLIRPKLASVLSSHVRARLCSPTAIRHPLILMCFFWGFPFCAPRNRRVLVLYCMCSVLIYTLRCSITNQVCWCNNVALHLCHIHNYYKNQNVKVEYYQVCWCNNVAVHLCHIIMAFILLLQKSECKRVFAFMKQDNCMIKACIEPVKSIFIFNFY